MTEQQNKLNITLDSTMLDTYQSCPAKFNYRFNHNKVTITKAKPLDRGSLVHHGLEAYYLALQAKKTYNEAVNDLIKALLAMSIESDLDDSEIERSREVLLESVEVNRARDIRFEILAVEKSFAYKLYEDDFMRLIMIGKIDLLVNYQDYQNVPIDHKTYERDFPLKRLTNQFCNYANACKSNYLFVNRIGFQKSIKPEIKHKFIPLSYDDTFLEQWKNNTIAIARQYAEDAMNNSWLMNLTSCDKYNRLCEYHEICDSSGESSKVFKLNANFNTAEPWDVSSALGKAKE